MVDWKNKEDKEKKGERDKKTKDRESIAKGDKKE